MEQTNDTFDELNIDLKSLFFRFSRNWYWFVLLSVIAVFVAWFQLKRTIPIYSVSGTMIIKENKRDNLSQENLIGKVGFGQSNNVQAEIQVLRSRSLMKKVVDALKLNQTISLEGQYVTSEAYENSPIKVNYIEPIEKAYGQKLRLVLIDSTKFYVIYKKNKQEKRQDTLIQSFNLPFKIKDVAYSIAYNFKTEDPIILNISNPVRTAQRFAKSLKVKTLGEKSMSWRNQSNNVIEFSMNNAVPEKAIDIINKVVEVYNDSKLTDKKETANNTLLFIDDRLKHLQEELFQVEKKVEKIKENRAIPLDISKNAGRLFDRLTNADETLTELNFKENFLWRIEKDLLTDPEQYDFIAISDEIGGVALTAFVDKYNELIIERSKNLIIVNANNPVIQTTNNQLKELKEKIIANIRLAINNIIDRKVVIQEKVDPITAQIAAIPRNERELLEIMRQQQIKQSLFLFLLKKREETALSLAAQTLDSKMLDEPIKPNKPVLPNRSKTYLIALILGLAIPSVIVYLREMLDNKIYGKKDIQELTKTPFLGMIGHSKDHGQIVVQSGKRTPVAEMFRLLRTNLNFLLPTNDNPCKIILTTSSVSGEGKTFISINLGASIALSGAKTLLIGMDLRKPKLAEYLGIPNSSVGVSSFLAGVTNEVEDLINPVKDFDNLFYISSGPIPPNPSELILNERTDALFDLLKSRFDYIIVDAPPIGLVTDAFLIGKYAKATLLVTKFKVSTKQQVKYFDEIYQQKKLPHPSIVLNGLQKSRGYGYGGYEYSYYQNNTKKGWRSKLPF